MGVKETNEFQEAQRLVEKLRREKDQAAGALQEVMKSLKEIGADTIEEAEEILKKKKKLLDQRKQEYNEKLAALREKLE